MLTSPFKSKSRLEAENAALRQQLIVLRRKVKAERADGRPLVFCPAVPMVPIDPRGLHDHSSRDVAALASGRLSSLLALEITASRRAAAGSDRAACAHIELMAQGDDLRFLRGARA